MNEFAKHLYSDDSDGYVQVIQFKKDKVIKILNTKSGGLKEIIEEQINQKDVFITPNTFYKPQRNADNIRQFRALFVDLDKVDGSKHSISYEIFEMAEKGEIPKPSMIVDSGQGLHLYWRIKNAPYSAIYTWQNIEDMLIHKLKNYGADSKVSDCSRILRLPNTINSKNNSQARILYIDDSIEYSMFDLKENYINKFKKNQIHKAKKNNNNLIKNVFFNSYSLHIARSNDLLKLCKLRNYDVKGHRNMILHCYAYWQGIYIRNEEELEEKVFDLNNKFKEPCTESQVKAILRCIPKAIDKFINYQQGINTGEIKRISKGMKNKGGYWYKNETLINKLDISDKEQEKLESIISVSEKYRRRNLIRTPKNKNGLTKKQEKLQELRVKAIELKDEGMSYRSVAKALNISLGSLQNILK